MASASNKVLFFMLVLVAISSFVNVEASRSVAGSSQSVVINLKNLASGHVLAS
ncbi:hypothetical protein MKX01_016828, partial [Papaver californicum]